MARLRETSRLLLSLRGHVSGCSSLRASDLRVVGMCCTEGFADNKLPVARDRYRSPIELQDLGKGMVHIYALSRTIGRLNSSFEVVGPNGFFYLKKRSYSSNAPGHAGVHELKLAQTGEGIAECELIRWFVEEGETVTSFQPICEVQSDKASVEITSRYDGKVIRIHFTPGDIVKVGETLCDVLPAGVHLPSKSNHSSSDIISSETIPIDYQYLAGGKASPATGLTASKDVLATPAVRHMAKSHGLNLSLMEGSGANGRILKEDLLQAVAEKQGVEEEVRMEEAAFEGRPEEEVEGWISGVSSISNVAFEPMHKEVMSDSLDVKHRVTKLHKIPIRGYQRTMAKTMSAAKTVPHFTFMEEVEVDALLKLRASLKAEAKVEGMELSPLSLMLKALSQALHKFPLLNSTVNCDVTEIHCKASHNIGVAMATSNGLVVPNIKHCEDRSIMEIGRELARLRQLAANNKLLVEDVTGGTVTVSNVGSIGGTYSVPLVNVPEVAIVALGRIQRLPRFNNEGNVVPVSIMQVSWSADHRVIDGATLANFCQEWKSYLERPDRLLLHLK